MSQCDLSTVEDREGDSMTAKKKDEGDGEEKTTDEIQNGGKQEIEDRLTDLEERINLIVRCNCLRETERG